ncbi:Pilus assembly protein PilQ [Candidatus Methylobacter favarea]|uniref:Pilus assembly protein PilQ n=2 Tax=Candidatus Methylobacter favarea TaxID=2707345 RepID=A0A8S0WIY4_9GAMM|nr:Pilus assembly protein PilQ [Candidatus Methylobacter favarea]
MNNKQGGRVMLDKREPSLWVLGLGLLLFIFQIASVKAGDLAISGIDIATLAGDKLQIQLEMTGPAITPKVFHTDNPARIALDFPGVKNALDKKMYPVNQGTASSIYVAEAGNRVRIVVNLIESAPFETKVAGNKVLLTLSRAKPLMPVASGPVSEKSTTSVIPVLLPQQAISGFDFKRGDNGEGRLLVSLANPNTVVNTKEEGGKVILSFLNTRLPEKLAKRLDVSEFGTPVKFIEAVASRLETTVTIVPQNSLYDYSLFQSDGLLTVEFRPLTSAEKEVLDSNRPSGLKRLTLNFQDIEIRSVIAILAEFTGQNIVAGDDVTGNITLKLDDVPWDEALDFIMMTKDLGKYESGNVTLISPLDKIKEYKKKQQETAAVVEQLDPLLTEYIKINYAKAEDFRNLMYGRDASAIGSCAKVSASDFSSSSGQSGTALAQSQYQMPGQGQNQNQNQGSSSSGDNSEADKDRLILLSDRGSAVVDSRTNTLIVRETAKRLEEIKKLIHQLDIPVRQVMIESRIVIASNTFARELGVRFGVAGNNVNFGTSSGAVGSVNGDGGTVGSINGTAIVNDALVDLGTSRNPYGALGMTLARGADYVLNLEISALQDQNRGELVSNPRVMTSDRCLAFIQQGAKIPYLSSSGNAGTNTVFIDAVLQLGVLPQITPNGNVIMGLYITRNTLGDVVTGNGDRQIDKREIKTSVQVKDGETVVLGGVFEGTQNNNTNKVPFFGDLPGIGFLFKRTFKQDDKRELLIFVTPKIITDNVATY